MVGGIVTETIVLKDRVWVNCMGRGSEKNTRCAIFVERDRNSLLVQRGDKLWWQGNRAFWTPVDFDGETPKDKRMIEIEIRRIGFSGVPRPTKTEATP